MFPWIWFWMPQYHFPWSGAVNQDISTDWFDIYVKPHAGNSDTERKAVSLMSYGTQLEHIINVLLETTGNQLVATEKSENSLEKLRELKTAVEAIKKLKSP